ncbi:unnamed protein product [Notodromas monacha]|uniref:Clathrin light chain n=1 Tax=Notodromas monacha TaxID=399045 RepID=A0A7R9BNZ4_9CRUS|nr:unnamed protein product [Notodromas monacha]CAG0918151.1 unnamed protein product [Notodromas monacha]
MLTGDSSAVPAVVDDMFGLDDGMSAFGETGGDLASEPASSIFPVKSPVPMMSSMREEPEKIRKWREEQKIRLEEKDKEEQVQIVKLREQAKRELEEWYKSHDEQIEKTKASNSAAQRTAHGPDVVRRDSSFIAQSFSNYSPADKEEQVQIVKLREQAKRELEEWYKSHDEQIEKTKASNRAAEKEIQELSAEVVPGQEWERIAKLCEFNPKNARGSKDTFARLFFGLQKPQLSGEIIELLKRNVSHCCDDTGSVAGSRENFASLSAPSKLTIEINGIDGSVDGF